MYFIGISNPWFGYPERSRRNKVSKTNGSFETDKEYIISNLYIYTFLWV